MLQDQIKAVREQLGVVTEATICSQLKAAEQQQRAKDLEIINANATGLNEEADDVLHWQTLQCTPKP
ncbi:MAG: hypothetical protein ACPGVP_08950 [Thiolinea sp.]